MASHHSTMYTLEIVFGLPLASYVGCMVCLLYMSKQVKMVDPSLSSTIVATLPSLTVN